jgi:rhodanese-related sulfurtransferase
MRGKKLIIVICLVLLPVHAFSKEVGWKWIKPGKVHGLLKEGSGIWLIDVRNSSQYDAVHIESSVNIPAAVLKNKKFQKSKFFVLADTSPGQRLARESADVLAEKGYLNVYVLEGGITGWELDDYPVVRSGEYGVLSVTAAELNRALENGPPLRVFDLRQESECRKGTIPGSRFVEGVDHGEKLEKLRALLAEKKGLSGKLAGHEMVVLVFSASDDAEMHTEMLSAGLKKDVRYLLGGYEVYEALRTRKYGETRKIGAGSTCEEPR